MDRAERTRIQEFIGDYDHGRTAQDIKIPEFVVEQLRDLIAEAAVTDAIPCSQCGQEAEWWTIAERGFCHLLLCTRTSTFATLDTVPTSSLTTYDNVTEPE